MQGEDFHTQDDEEGSLFLTVTQGLTNNATLRKMQ